MKRGSNTRRTHSLPLCVSLRLLGNYSADDSLWYSCLNLSSGINFLLEAFYVFMCFFVPYFRTCKYFQVATWALWFSHYHLINWFLKVLLFLVSAALHFKSNRHKFYLNQFIYKYCVFFRFFSACRRWSVPHIVMLTIYLHWAAHSGHADANKN